MIKCSVCILTYNNEDTLEKALGSVKDFSDLVILDGGSTDNTLEIAKKFNVRVFPQADTVGKIGDFTLVRKKLFSLANESWVLWLDSDEWLSNDAISNIKNIVEKNEAGLYSFIRKIVIGDKIIEHAYFYPEYCKRLWSKSANIELKKGKRVHENLTVKEGIKQEKISSIIYHSWWESYKQLIKKDNYYLNLTVEGKEYFNFLKRLRVAYINALKAIKVLLKSLFIYFRYGFKKSLPILYSWRFVRYHLIYAKKILFLRHVIPAKAGIQKK